MVELTADEQRVLHTEQSSHKSLCSHFQQSHTWREHSPPGNARPCTQRSEETVYTTSHSRCVNNHSRISRCWWHRIVSCDVTPCANKVRNKGHAWRSTTDSSLSSLLSRHYTDWNLITHGTASLLSTANVCRELIIVLKVGLKDWQKLLNNLLDILNETFVIYSWASSSSSLSHHIMPPITATHYLFHHGCASSCMSTSVRSAYCCNFFCSSDLLAYTNEQCTDQLGELFHRTVKFWIYSRYFRHTLANPSSDPGKIFRSSAHRRIPECWIWSLLCNRQIRRQISSVEFSRYMGGPYFKGLYLLTLLHPDAVSAWLD